MSVLSAPEPADLETVDDLAREIVRGWDGGRLAFRGGYRSDMEIENGQVYVATLDHDGAPRLVSQPVEGFVREGIECGSFGEPGDPMYERATEIFRQREET